MDRWKSIVNRRVGLFLAGVAMLGLACGVVQAQSSEAERQAMIDLYNATGGDQWQNNRGWRSGVGSHCNWYGVVCSPQASRHVTQLLLNQNNLTGQLPDSLAGLRNLTVLRLDNNDLSGEISTNLWGLPRLNSLSLTNNRFSGLVPVRILTLPAGETTIAFNLSNNLLEGFEPVGFPGALQGSDIWLNVSGNRINEFLPVTWRQQARFRVLDLSRNHLGPAVDMGGAPLPGLETLRLAGNEIASISGFNPSMLPDLRRLDLSNNQLIHWPLSEEPFSNLEELNLGANEITELPASLTEHEKLEILNLSDNRLAGELPEWFGELSVRELGLGNNDLEGAIEDLISALDTDSIVVSDDESQPPFARPRLRLHIQNNHFIGSLPEDLDYRKFNTPYEVSRSPEFGLDLCFNDIEPPSPELLESIHLVHRGLGLSDCLGRERYTLDLTLSGSWYDPQRSGEGLTQMLLTDGQVLSYWFTYYPRQASSTDPEGQMWLFDVSPPQEKHIEQRDLLIPAGGRFGEGFPAQGPERQRWRARTRQDRVGSDTLHFAYELHHRALCISWGCFFAVRTGRQDLVPLTRLAGTTCDNRQPNEWVSGAWYNPESNGEGFVVEVIEDGRGVVYWFTYQPGFTRQQAWMMGDGHFEGQTLIIDNLVQPVGTRFGQEFDTEEIDFAHWGSLVMEFHDEMSGHILYDSVINDYGSGGYSIERLARPMLAECE